MKACVLLSGGPDSILALQFALSTTLETVALWVDYGQPARIQERAHATNAAQTLGVPLMTAYVQLQLNAMGDSDGVSGPRIVPARNAVLLSLAVNHVEADLYFIGACAADTEYPDCQPEFFEAMSAALSLAAGRQVRVVAPLQTMTKAEILSRVAVPSWSCYTPINGNPCRTCNSCKIRGDR